MSKLKKNELNFYTEGYGETNHIPFSPELVQLVINEVLQTTTATLKWNANDVDTNDNLSFDVYFGTVNPPTIKVSDNLTSNLIEVDIVASTNYY